MLYLKRIKVRQIANGFMVYYSVKTFEGDDTNNPSEEDSKELFFANEEDVKKFVEENR